MGIFDKKMEPVFLKESSDAERHIKELESLLLKATGEVKERIEKDIKLLSYGIKGEKNIAFELKNSHIPMYILHDVYFEDEELSAQIDYLVITQKRIFVIECKNLYGDIEINRNGDFIRTFTINGRKIKEGIYSPITQNKRHLDLLRKVRRKQKNNMITKVLFESNFENYYKSIVVLANPKTILDMKYAPKETKSKVIRGDQLIEYIKKMNSEPGIENSSIKAMEDLANSFLGLCSNNKVDYAEKYKECVNIGTSELSSQLKAFRLKKSREESVKPYFLFNDKQLEDLINKRPQSRDKLKSISGFGEIKCEKYGNEILKIISGSNKW